MTLGGLALLWQDMSLLILSLAFGVKLVMTGIMLLWRAGKTKPVRTKRPRPATALKRVGRTAEVVVLVGLAVGLTIDGISLHRSAPVPDEFYSWTAEIPAPGQLLRYERYAQAVPEGVVGWRILYSTTRDAEGLPAVASAFVMTKEAGSGEARPVVAWAHGTTGVVPGCAPTVLPEPFPLDATVPAVEQVFDSGWVLVGTDYAGLGTVGPHPYLIGQGEARSVLDAVRAAKQMGELNLLDQTVVWGHSQGGHAALWTGGLAESYAPDVNVIGVAAAAPATELPTLLDKSKNSPVGKIMGSFALRAYSEIYADVSFNDYANPFLRPVIWSMTERCLAERATLLSLAATLAMPGAIYSGDPMNGALGRRLNDNVPTLPIVARLFIAQGGADPLVLPEVQQTYVDGLRASGQELEYKVYPGLDHLTLVAEESPFNDDLTAWTRAVLTGFASGQ
jgi:alpha-beta hydrolase superfamily lysophospholipase